MPVKRKAKSAPGKLRAKSGGSAGSRSRSPSGKKKGRTAKSAAVKGSKPEVDILGPAAMQNLYYIAHTPVDALEMRGFGWPEAPKGKKGKKGKKKKK